MGITCKPIGKFESVMAKMEYQMEREKAEQALAQRKNKAKGRSKNTK